MVSLTQYPYLYLSLGLFAVALIFYLALPAYRRVMLISGLLSAPFSLLSVFFVPQYWQPPRLAVAITGLEDIIFSFANGVIIVGLIARLLPIPPERWGSPWECLKRFVMLSLPAIVVMIGLNALGLRVMSATLLAGGMVVLPYLWSRQKRAVPLSLAGGIGFGLFYCLLLWPVLHHFPTLKAWWAAEGLAGIWVWGLPLGEVLWAVYFGAAWPLFMAWTLGWDLAGSKIESGLRGTIEQVDRAVLDTD